MNTKKKAGSTKERSLLSKTRHLLKATKFSQLEIYQATGLTPFWLTSISTGKVSDPSVNKIQTLYEFLSGKHLSV